MFARKVVYTLFGVVLLVVLATSTTGANMNASRTTYFTFSGAVQLPGVALDAGTYIFEVANPDGSSDVVKVLSRDRKKLYLMRLTRTIERRSGGNLDAAITLGETAAGIPPKVKAWFPQSETRGREFIY